MNKKDIIKLIITGILSLVFILLVINSMSAVKNARELKKKALCAPELTLIQGKENNQDKKQAGKFTYKKLEEKSMSLMPTRDPFSDLPVTIINKSSPNTLSLSGILWDTQNPLALINGMTVKVGDKVRNYIITNIEQDKVVLNDGTKDFELKIE